MRLKILTYVISYVIVIIDYRVVLQNLILTPSRK